MRKAIAYLSALGIVGGALFIVGPWVFGVPGPSLRFVIAPTVLGALVMLTHWRNLKRLRSESGHLPFIGALVANGALLGFFVIGGVWLSKRDSALPRFPIAAVLFTLLFLVPLSVNAIYAVIGRKHE